MPAEEMFIVRPGESRPTRVPMPGYRVLAGDNDTGMRFSFLEVVVIHDVPSHIHHRDAESALVVEGELRFTYQGVDYDAGPGTYIYLPKGVAHSVTRLSKTNPKVLQVASPGGFEHMAEDLVEAAMKHGAGMDVKNEQFRLIALKYGLEFLPG